MSYCYLNNIDVSYFELCASDKFSITMIDDLCDQIVTSLVLINAYHELPVHCACICIFIPINVGQR